MCCSATLSAGRMWKDSSSLCITCLTLARMCHLVMSRLRHNWCERKVLLAKKMGLSRRTVIAFSIFKIRHLTSLHSRLRMYTTSGKLRISMKQLRCIEILCLLLRTTYKRNGFKLMLLLCFFTWSYFLPRFRGLHHLDSRWRRSFNVNILEKFYNPFPLHHNNGCLTGPHWNWFWT